MVYEHLSLKEKIYQMFILGFEGTELNSQNLNIQNALDNGLGGVIFFAENFNRRENFKTLVKNLREAAKIPIFTTIDQEGGLVERTIKLDKKIDYLTPRALSQTGCAECVKSHYEILSQDLNDLGINMNFAPVLDVNTNPKNPIIGIRSYGDNPDNVIKYSKVFHDALTQNNIIATGKHFTGHGEACIDSHLDMPQITLALDELENIHIKPFEHSIKCGIPAVMVAHVHYPAFDDEVLPASLSKNVIGYLKDRLGFNGLIISDDMVMGGITNQYDSLDACIKGIEAGIDLFIFRHSDEETINLIEKIVEAVKMGMISEDRINESIKKILFYKEKYGILSGQNSGGADFSVEEGQKLIDKIALKSVKQVKKGELPPLDQSKKILILSPDKKNIYNYSFDEGKLSDFVDFPNVQEKTYSLNPDKTEINTLLPFVELSSIVIFISYNAVFNPGQTELFNKINEPVILIAAGNPDDVNYLKPANSVFQSFCYKTPSLKALANMIFHDSKN